MNEPKQEYSDNPPGRERGSSGLGSLITIGTLVAAGVAAVVLFAALHVFSPLILATMGGLALLGGGLMVLQNHKEHVNDAHARDAYCQTEGYHKEPEAVKDQSLMHLIKGRNDLPERVQYIRDNYGITPLSASQYRGKYLGTGLLLGLAVGGVVMAGLAALTVGTFGMAGLAFAGVMGALAGGTALAAHSAHTMTRYDKYIDSLAAKGEARKAEREKCQAVEYDNGCHRTRTFCEDVKASRQQRGVAQISH
jgi:hypothetical protein